MFQITPIFNKISYFDAANLLESTYVIVMCGWTKSDHWQNNVQQNDLQKYLWNEELLVSKTPALNINTI